MSGDELSSRVRETIAITVASRETASGLQTEAAERVRESRQLLKQLRRKDGQVGVQPDPIQPSDSER
jgi:hypothetical protein